MRIKLVSDGTTVGTVIYDLDTGKEVTDVMRIRIEMDASNPGIVEATVTRFLLPDDGEFRPIETTIEVPPQLKSVNLVIEAPFQEVFEEVS